MEVLIDVSGVNKEEEDLKRFAVKTSLNPEAQELVDPFDEVQETLVRWYLEEHPIHDPLEKTKASLAETELSRYGQRIAKQIGLFQVHAGGNEEIGIKIQQQEEDASNVSGYALHWEALEGANDQNTPDTVTNASPVVVSRLVTPSVDFQAEVPHRDVAEGPFRILLVVARQDLLEPHHRIVSTALRRIAAAMGSERIEVDMVRPGTFAELTSQLELHSQRSIRTDLVHFDLHGEVKEVHDGGLGGTRFESYLRFFPQSEGGSGLRKASGIAKLLRKHHIPMVVINACESARSDLGSLANMAHVFVRSGTPMVLAMSYKLNVDALSVFFGTFYDSLLNRGRDFSQAAADGRKAMRLNRKRRGYMGLELNLLDWIVPATYIASGLDLRVSSTRFAIKTTTCGPQQLGDNPCIIDQSLDTGILNLETRLFDPWRCGAGPIVNVCGFDGIGKRTFLQHCQQWWTETLLFDHILRYTCPRGQAFPTATEILAWMASQLQPRGPPHDEVAKAAEDVILGWLGKRRWCRKRLLVILENFSVFQVDNNGVPRKAMSAEEERGWRGLFQWMADKGIWAVVSSVSKLSLITAESRSPDADAEEHLFPTEPIDYQGARVTPWSSPHYYLPGSRNASGRAGMASNMIFSSLSNVDDIAGMRDLIDCLAGLPPLLELVSNRDILSADLAGSRPAEIVRYFITGQDPFRRDADLGRELPAMQPVFSLLEKYYAHQGPLARLILFSLSLFSRSLGRNLEDYCSDFIFCLHKVASLFARTNKKIWLGDLVSVFESGQLESAEDRRRLVVDCLGKVIWDLSALGVLKKDFFYIEESRGPAQTHDDDDDDDGGGGGGGEEEQRVRVAPLYRPHPCLTIFLRRQFAKEQTETSQDGADTDEITLETKMAFISYHRSRLEAWPAAAKSKNVFAQVSQSVEEREGILNFLGALEMWLAEDLGHRDYSYPKRLFSHLSRPLPQLTKDIEPSNLAPYVIGIKDRLSQLYQELDRQSRPEQQPASKISRVIRHLGFFQRHEESPRLREKQRVRLRWQYYAALAFYLRLTNWLSYYYVVHGMAESAARGIRDCASEVSARLTPYHRETCGLFDLLPVGLFPGAARLRTPPGVGDPPKLAQEVHMINNTTGLKKEADLIEWASSFLQRTHSVTLQTWAKAYEQLGQQFGAFRTWLLDGADEVVRPWSTAGVDMLKKGWVTGHTMETWGYRTREEVEQAPIESEAELRRNFVALVGTAGPYFDQVLHGLRILGRIIYRHFDDGGSDNDDSSADSERQHEGNQQRGIGDLLESVLGMSSDEDRGGWAEVVRNLPFFDQLSRIWSILKRAQTELREGIPPSRVFDEAYPQVKHLISQFWRRFLMWELNFGMQENQVFHIKSVHQLLIKSYMDRCDWDGLNEHLHNIDLDAEQGGKCQWYAVQGVCSVQLGNWEEAATYLARSLGEVTAVDRRDEYILGNFGIFGLSSGFNIQFILLRYMIAAKYGGGEQRTTPTLMPAWKLFLEALRLGYGAPAGAIYGWNGSILEQLTQHYLEQPGSLRDVQRVVQLPRKEDFCAAIKAYQVPLTDEDGGIDTKDIPEHQRPLYTLLEFLHYKKARNEMDYDRLGQDAAAFESTSSSYSTNPATNTAMMKPTKSLNLSRASASIVFLRTLQNEVAQQWETRLDVMESFERFLMGKSVVAVPAELVRLGA
ncbi:hypothetical protein B0T25DRAFT_132399 [Lasiosphaeria hispida]|uniref:CHAT domain-containing protein n=1 Tax=Lasiosphaeria hispida TaxID=260671 RepID=A0AAJ0MIY3_9PEZI|nr:hypothetical protein B0T25DRAFT_132399 [Lasiosphaeria hispida]